MLWTNTPQQDTLQGRQLSKGICCPLRNGQTKEMQSLLKSLGQEVHCLLDAQTITLFACIGILDGMKKEEKESVLQAYRVLWKLFEREAFAV